MRFGKCNQDGFRLIKKSKYIYDPRQEKCVARVRNDYGSCGASNHVRRRLSGNYEDDNNYVPRGGPAYSRWRNHPLNGGRSAHERDREAAANRRRDDWDHEDMDALDFDDGDEFGSGGDYHADDYAQKGKVSAA